MDIRQYLSKHEIRNSKFETIPNDQNTKFQTVLVNVILDLFTPWNTRSSFHRVKDFDIRISDLRGLCID